MIPGQLAGYFPPAMMRIRTATECEFRANLHQNGNTEVIKLTKEEKTLVLEVNSSPGLEGVEKATETDIAGRIIKFLEKQQEIKSAAPQNVLR